MRQIPVEVALPAAPPLVIAANWKTKLISHYYQ